MAGSSLNHFHFFPLDDFLPAAFLPADFAATAAFVFRNTLSQLAEYFFVVPLCKTVIFRSSQ